MRELDKGAIFPIDNIYERYEDDERLDHNTDTPIEFCHSQENNKV